MIRPRPTVLSIAGFDPSGGAGILSDIKTFEANKMTGLGVCSSITFQNDAEFDDVKWLPLEEIIRQIEVLKRRFKIDWVKIGLIESLDVLNEITNYLEAETAANILWDPILRASAGFPFHRSIEEEQLLHICKKLYLITPNFEEIKKMFPTREEDDAAKYLGKYCSVLLKGGHRETNKAVDILYEYEKETILNPTEYGSSKHGSGCVLSSAILAQLAKGETLEEACKKGKEYVTKFLLSHKDLLGYHHV